MSSLLIDATFGTGSRSCLLGGHWRHAVGPDGLTAFKRVGATLRESVGSQAMWEELVADLNSVIKRAERGDLTFDSYVGGRRISKDVGRCASVDDVLEIRVTRFLGRRGEELLLRLYFSEPSDVDELLLSLNLQHKSPGPLGLEEQDKHMRYAQDVFNYWDEKRVAVGK